MVFVFHCFTPLILHKFILKTIMKLMPGEMVVLLICNPN